MAELETAATNTTETTDTPATEQTAPQSQPADENAEITRLKAELARAKAATDKATKEAGDFKKQLRARQTAEEAQAEERQELQAAMERELAELRKEKAVAVTSKKAMTFLQDEATSTGLAEALYGCADPDLAIDLIVKAWAAKEKALKLEYGKVPAPGIGGADGPSITRQELDAMTLKDRVEFANKHKDEYNKLMGR